MRIIDADELIETIDFEARPVVDAELVRHGHWKMRKNWTYMVCSACSFKVPYNIFNYCPNCGAKMDEEKKQ